MNLYVKYSRKYPYLPVAVADTMRELAEMTRVHPTTVIHCMMEGREDYAKVVIPEGDEDYALIRSISSYGKKKIP